MKVNGLSFYYSCKNIILNVEEQTLLKLNCTKYNQATDTYVLKYGLIPFARLYKA